MALIQLETYLLLILVFTAFIQLITFFQNLCLESGVESRCDEPGLRAITQTYAI